MEAIGNPEESQEDDEAPLDEGWWVIVASIPETDTGRMGDDSVRFTAAGKRCGYTVFNDFSWKFKGFAPGYNVFVIGAYQSSAEAKQVAVAVEKCLPGAYVKYGRYVGE
ncbi:SPOR domain-containing protein [Microvirga lenta]|uniref:SPOR domain-containing protein n=1 Tax=Microvirga lenta TaxID=2881337 RepID=UPI001CFD3363|nr:SPOR domain-containing protein [Microvirga lenta]MCB5173658.1 SPOR domain-containing protein [Microvirga lenta]